MLWCIPCFQRIIFHRTYLVLPRVGEVPPFSLDRVSDLFLLSSSIYSLKKELEKLQTSHSGQIHELFELIRVPYSAFEMKEHSVCIHISHRSHWTALWQLRTAPLHRPQSQLCSLCNTKFQFLIQVLTIQYCRVQTWWVKTLFTVLNFDPFLWRFTVFFAKTTTKPWTGISSNVSSQDYQIAKLVPLEGLKLRMPS